VSDQTPEFPSLHDIVHRAKMNLSDGAWGYLAGGAESETTLRRNRQALDTLAFRPRVCRNVHELDTSATLLGQKMRIPVMLAPIGSLETFDPSRGGGATSGKAAEDFDVVHMLSSRCAPGLEETAAAADNARIFQLYVRGDASFEDDYVKRAIDNGYYAFAVTVDTAHYSRRERDFDNRFVKTWRVGAGGMEYQALYTWDNVKRFKDKHDIPLILKGIATAEDAALCVEHGVDGVYVSNHGGRQLDHGRGAMDVLPEVVEAVGGKAAVIVDGAINRGTDVVKAMALGADAVGIGRMQGYGLAADGKDGLVRVLELLEEEIQICFGLLGVTSFAELNASYLHKALPVNLPHVTSAFPLIDLDHPY
jgi:isopentenyl diphosphate isomerase/L-lactate dehydrogenase-like FMN-dependent dehydrogenase